MSDFGQVTLSRPACAPTIDGHCYYNYFDGVKTNVSFIPPTFANDQGTGCVPIVASGGVAVHSVCNNGREAYLGYFPPMSPGITALYAGPNPSDLLSLNGIGNQIYMNGTGNIVWNDATREEWYEAIDLTTAPVPEPSNILLFCTGILAAASAIRRRRYAQLKG